MARKMKAAERILGSHLLVSAERQLHAGRLVGVEGATLDSATLTTLERSALDTISLIQQYRQTQKPLFTQGQKS